ncbi:MAG: GHKL domain-containing protein [Bryobacteraceae bacterium]|nr:GHKL domain-containing protein [Bryobacteraceae bacterium]
MASALVEKIRSITLLSDYSDEELQWFEDNGIEARFAPGEIISAKGDPADRIVLLLEGEVEGRSDDRSTYIAKAGEITGKLPHSRMEKFFLTVRAVGHVHAVSIEESKFGEMLERLPKLEVRLIRLMADRIRDFTASEVQQSKLAALGKLSAGLAHELNNPASAAARAADSLREKLVSVRDLDCAIAAADLTPQQRAAIVTAESKALAHARSCVGLDAMTRSDREDELGSLLSGFGVKDGWDLAPELADAGFDAKILKDFASQTGPVMREALGRVASLIALDRLAEEIQDSMGRISGLVKAIKEYSYMDSSKEREVDIHKDIENTLRILDSKIRRSGVDVQRDYDKTLPLICANGSELNQVWTNLIDNAIDAMENTSGEKMLRIRTTVRLDRIVVEVLDTGPGIPEELRQKIFEPFFTTKKQGQGTGLGLDFVQKIVRRHHGDLRLESKPGRTCFQILLPISRPNGSSPG